MKKIILQNFQAFFVFERNIPGSHEPGMSYAAGRAEAPAPNQRTLKPSSARAGIGIEA